MTGLEPIAVATLTKAIDFLFNQAGVILDEIRENRRKSGETVDAPPGQPEGTLSTRAELESLQPKTIILKDTQQEIEHCLKQIYQYRSNQRIILEQISHVGGIPRASIGQINDLSSQDEELKKSIQKLKNLVEQVYGQKLRIVGLE